MLENLDYQEVLGAIAFIISIWGSVVYILSIFRGETKPHLYTWVVFSILTCIAFVAQLSDNAGPGAWMMGATTLSCLSVAILSLKYGNKNHTKSDKIALFASLAAIIPWLLTQDPLLSVIMISLIDGIVMYPTIRKSWSQPYQENLPTYWIANLKNIIALFALTNFSLITSLYLISIMVVNTTLIAVCVYRRRKIPN
jgi:Ca2+/Na+ antiporter